MQRREFFKYASTCTAALLTDPVGLTQSRGGWSPGQVAHLLPTVNDRRFLIKLSLRTAIGSPPRLRVDDKVVVGSPTDTRGLFWVFDADGLTANTRYELRVEDEVGSGLCDPWSLSTFPSPGERPEKFRLLVYTCAGGRFLGMATKQRLLQRGLSFAPDALVAIGDHVYWDLRRTGQGSTRASIEFAGRFDRNLPVLGTPNEAVLTKVVNAQVAELYGTSCRSVPVFFLQDDHDYFENDHADESIVTFPPDHFMMRLGRASQWMYYPEFLPDAQRPSGLPGASAADRPAGVGESYGTLRYGSLVEAALYDCRRYMTLKGPSSVFISPEAERWLMDRMTSREVTHFVHMPSTPVGWSAGKWAEWYPDVLNEQGELIADREKFMWQPGWLAQHDRLLQAASAMERVPLFVSGDLHSLAEGRIRRSGQIDLRSNPIVSIICGPLGTGRGGWPSTFRGTRGLPPGILETDEALPCLEENGFSLIDFSPEKIVVRFFRWNNRTDPVEAIDTLEPFRVTELG